MRWARRMAPNITRIKHCIYQCQPELPHCPNHTEESAHGQVESESVPMPFIEIGHGAKLGTILGSVDLAQLTNAHNPKAALLPGAIPMANRGVVFIDEINRLAETAPEITDVLLSVMGTKPGKIKIEEVGLQPWEIQIVSSVWATSNPDEDPGPLEEIRRQLSDRFDMVVPVQRPSDPLVIQKLLWSKHQAVSITDDNPGITQSIQQKAVNLSKTAVPQTIIRYMAELYIEKNIESLRAIESLELSSRCLAVIRGKEEVSFEEISTVLPLVLRHRVEPIVLSEILKDLELRKAASVQVRASAGPESGANTPNKLKIQDTPNSSNTLDSTNGPVPKTRFDSHDNGRNSPTGSPEAGHSTQSPAPHSHGPGESKTKSGNNAPGNNGHRQISWLQRLLSRCRSTNRSGFGPKHAELQPGDPGGHAPGSPMQSRHLRGKQDGMGQSASGKTSLQQQNPARVPPVSPPDAARHIGHLTWEEILLPSEWKDHMV